MSEETLPELIAHAQQQARLAKAAGDLAMAAKWDAQAGYWQREMREDQRQRRRA